jgi:hypothetical protein
MPVPLNRSEYTKIYDRYTKPTTPLTEALADTSQDLPQANPQQQNGQQPLIKGQQTSQQPVEDSQHMKDFTDTLTRLQEVISKFKDPTTVQNAAKAIQELLAKNPKQASTPVGTSQYLPANAQQSPAEKGNNNIPGSTK